MLISFLEQLNGTPFFQDLLFLIIIISVVIFYIKSKISRKTFTCPNCGSKITVEHMNAKHCDLCGHRLIEDIDSNEN